MKRFLVFFYEQYKVKGGFCDFITDYDDLEPAMAHARSCIISRSRIEVYDTLEKRVAYQEGTWVTDVMNPLTTFNIALPHVAPYWNLKDFVSQIDDKYWRYFVVSDHSKGQDTKKFRLEELGARVIFNEGGSISSAWNAALKENQDFTIICSVSTRFYWGLECVVDEFKRNMSLYAAETQLGFHLAAVTREWVQKVGYIDENFQAYGEDTDAYRRMNMAGVSSNRFNVNAMLAGLGIAQKSGQVIQNWQLTDDYYRAKWGNVSGRETWANPYNEPDKDFTYWRKMSPEEITERAKKLK